MTDNLSSKCFAPYRDYFWQYSRFKVQPAKTTPAAVPSADIRRSHYDY
ncbi:MAG: hypothetical protein LW859_05030 [Anabaena sp. 49633_E8]|nr:hypothetical protein [Anabaena sp. 49633_E8]